jgi:hypothetical protein
MSAESGFYSYRCKLFSTYSFGLLFQVNQLPFNSYLYLIYYQLFILYEMSSYGPFDGQN